MKRRFVQKLLKPVERMVYRMARQAGTFGCLHDKPSHSAPNAHFRSSVLQRRSLRCSSQRFLEDSTYVAPGWASQLSLVRCHSTDLCCGYNGSLPAL